MRSKLIFVCVIMFARSIVMVAATAQDDIEFMDTYGMNEFTPGHWDGLRDFRDDWPKHRRLCQRAHNTSGTQPPGLIDETGFCQKTLKFDNSTGYRPIELDVLMYTLEGHRKSEFYPYFFYFAKGLDPGCVYYLKPLDEIVKFVALDRHVCGIDMTHIFYWPEDEMDISEEKLRKRYLRSVRVTSLPDRAKS